jgi:hypothetical protein
MWRPTDPHVLNRIICDQKHKFIRKTNSYFVTDRAFQTMKEELKLPSFPTIRCTHPTKKIPSILEMRALCKPTIRWDILSVAELKNVAKQRGIKGYYKLNKLQLIHHLNA